MILRDLAAATPSAMPRRREADLLHTLCGSARAVGAWEVATGAEQLERLTRGSAADEASPDRMPEPADLMAALDGSVERACRAIEDLRGADDDVRGADAEDRGGGATRR